VYKLGKEEEPLKMAPFYRKHKSTAAPKLFSSEIAITIYNIMIYDDDDDDDDFSLFQVRLLDNYKDRSPGLHMWTLPPLVPTSHSLVYHQTI